MQRPGFLTRAGFLSSYSHYDATGPILRGAFITIFTARRRPGPAAARRDDDQAAAGTLRDERASGPKRS